MINTIPVCIFYSSIIFDNKPMIIIIIIISFGVLVTNRSEMVASCGFDLDVSQKN